MKSFSKTKFSVSNENKYYVGVKPQPTLNCVGHIEKRLIKNSLCHPELTAPLVADEKEAYKGGCSQSISGSGRLQKYSAICTQKSVSGKKVLDKVGWAFSPTMKLCWGRNPNIQKAISYASRTATRHVKGDLVPAFTLAEVFSPYYLSPRRIAFTLAEVFLPSYHSPRKVAFTLAEVLITLGIIGVVAAMTLPTLINNSRNKELEAALKKNYSIIQQAFDMYQAQNGERLIPENIAGGKLKGYIMPYFNVIKDCGVGHDAASYDPECGMTNSANADNRKSIYKTFSGLPLVNLAMFDDGQFILSDGSIIYIENAAPDMHRVFISVDVNGAAKRPNQYGYDLFTFQLMDDGKILPVGAPETYRNDVNRYCSKTSSTDTNGVACTYYALTDKNYWKNLK